MLPEMFFEVSRASPPLEIMVSNQRLLWSRENQFSGVDTLFGLKNIEQGTFLVPFGELFELIFDVVFDVFFGVVFCSVSVSFWALLGSLRDPKGIPKRIQKGAKGRCYLEPGRLWGQFGVIC